MTDTVDLIVKNFVSRPDLKARQGPDGTWYQVQDKDHHPIPWKRQDFIDHLNGTTTYGHYLLSVEDTCKFFAFDIDLDKTGFYTPFPSLDELTPEQLAQEEPDPPVACNPRVDFNTPGHPCIPWFNFELRCLSEGLARRIASEYDIMTLIAFSGNKGVHVYGMTGPTNAAAAQEAAFDILKGFHCFEPVKGSIFWKHTHAYKSMTIEVFPKQTTNTGSGNLMRLPLGVNTSTGRKSFPVKLVHPSYEFTSRPLEEALIMQPWE